MKTSEGRKGKLNFEHRNDREDGISKTSGYDDADGRTYLLERRRSIP